MFHQMQAEHEKIAFFDRCLTLFRQQQMTGL